MTLWLDYSAGRISGADLRDAGVTGVIRYVGIGGSGKRLTASEYDDLVAHGILVHGVVEQWIGDADGGYPVGLHHASVALADILSITRGHGLPVVYAANDQQTSSQANVDYVHAFTEVFGHGVAGAYGFAPHLRNCFGQNVCSNYWLAGHPPSIAGLTGIVNVWQRQGTWGNESDGPALPWQGSLAGIGIDYNNSYKDIAVTPPVRPPARLREDDDAMYILNGSDDGTNPRGIAILSGPIFMGLGPQGSGEYKSAMDQIAKGAVAQWVEDGTFHALDAASHGLRDNPRPVTVVPPAV